MICAFWNWHTVIWFKLLNPDGNVDIQWYKQQFPELYRTLCQNRPEYQLWQHNLVFFDDYAPDYRTDGTRDFVESWNWELLAHAAYGPHLAPTEYDLFASMVQNFPKQRFFSFKGVKNWVVDWFKAKQEIDWLACHKLPQIWQPV